ncbi:MAG: S8 family serine peptidase, partial [Psychrosphaera sp.]|nr:S8 family serine peptidase [Psychrosphaera sp.]
LVDTAINVEHPALIQSNIKQRSFVKGNRKEPTNHGTEIAGILVGVDEHYRGLLPKNPLLGASVFFQVEDKGNIATTHALLQGLNWLAENEVKVINMSLSGPPNRLLQYAIGQLCQQNIVVVAAVGNTGPLSKPLYPAGYACTIAVTAVDHNKRIYKNAVIGKHVDMAAFGVDIQTLDSTGGYKNASGTSLATAFVSAFIATEYNNDKIGTGRLENWLGGIYRNCADLGAKGHDPVYGYGLLPTAGRGSNVPDHLAANK